jgi:GTPase SAR1 family protein
MYIERLKSACVTIMIYERCFCVQVVDTAGQDELSLLPSIYAVNVDAYVLVYSVQSMVSFQIVQSIYERLIAASGLLTGRFPVVLVATKVDLKPAPRPRVELPPWLIDSHQSDGETPPRSLTPETAFYEFVPRIVSCEAGRSLAAQWQAAYVETSALDNINVAKVFEIVAERLKEADDGRFLMSTTGLNEKPSWSRRKSKVPIPKRGRLKQKPVLDSWWRKLTCTSSTATSESNM